MRKTKNGHDNGKQVQINGRNNGMAKKTPAEREAEEQARLNGLEQEFLARGYVRQDRIISAAKANVLGVLLLLPPALICWIWYLIVYGSEREAWESIVVLPLMVLFILLHELTHAAVGAHFSRNGWKSIKLGILWKSLNPYCAVLEPLELKAYKLYCVMPLLVEGILPFAAAMLTGSYTLMAVSVIMIIAAGGDFLMLVEMRKDRDCYVLDHPSMIGCILFKKETAGEKQKEAERSEAKSSE